MTHVARNRRIELTEVNRRGRDHRRNRVFRRRPDEHQRGLYGHLPDDLGHHLRHEPGQPVEGGGTGSLIDSIAGSNGSTYAATGTGSERPTLATVGSNKLARFAGSHELIVDPALATAMSGDPAYTIVAIGSVTTPGSGSQYFFVAAARRPTSRTCRRRPSWLRDFT